MRIRAESLLYIGVGIVLSIVATFSLFQHREHISNHGDINRGLIYSGVAQQSILTGEFPLWNPYVCGGVPLAGDVESWFLHPFFPATIFLNPVLGMKVVFTLTLLTAFVGFTFLGRKILSFNYIGSLTFGVIMAFSGYISQHLAEGYYVWVSSAWIPWFLLAGITSLQKPKYVPVAGLFLALMFGAGSMHMVVYSLLFLGLFFLFEKSSTSTLQRIGILLGIVLFFALISSVKLLPALSVLETNESRVGFTPSITLLPKMLLGRGLLPSIMHEGSRYRFGEFGNYIGYATVLLGGTALFCKREGLWKKYRAFFLVALVMLVLCFISLPITHGYISRVADLFRMPSRLMIFPIIGIAILAARGIEVIASYKRLRVVSGILFILLAGDLISNDYILFARTFTLPLPEEIHVEDTFRRVKHSYTTPDETYYRAAYVDFLENRGVNDLCRFYQQAPAASTINGSDKKKPDKGEVYLQDDTAGKVYLLERSNNELRLYANIKTATSVVVNMNYYPEWITKEGLLVHNENGLIATQVTPGEHVITFRYTPSVVYWGMLVSVLGILVGAVLFVKL